ncbi:D-alanyl-D-alanine carboxypeptidase/D-alanyl-D-alanine-endopeptidase [Acidihalobacter ferrooxydans]|nr:D-alanyl-D-alanine carboxypeptidase/D-alanyl-D-alanine-endopeptidase [Acidihalobacter ferrooxydans]
MKKYRILAGLCVLFGFWSVAQAESLPNLHALAAHGAVVTARVIDLNNGRTLAALHPAQMLTPASVSKLYVTAAALHQWGAAYRFTTAALYRGTIRNATLHGDLVLQGSGDPGLTNAQLWTLAQRVRAAGIKRIDGAVIVDESLFGRVRCATTDRCEALASSRAAYNAPLSAAGFDYSNACLWVRPATQAGTPATLGFEPFKIPMLGLRGTIETLPKGAANTVRVTRVTTDGRNWFYVRGGVAVDTPARCYYRAISEPALYTGQSFIGFLRQAGIAVKHLTARIVTKPMPDTRPLAQVQGQSLGEELRGMLVYSNNYMADTLALDLARTADSAPISLHQAGAWLTRYARRINTESDWPGARKSKPRLFSGSGLTADSKVSANDLIALLAAEYHNYADFPTFLSTLTVPDQTPVKMLKGGPRIWETRIAAKTGSLSRPVSVLALAGYLRLRDGHWGAFAVIVNGTRQRPEIGMFTALDAVRADLVKILRTSGN